MSRAWLILLIFFLFSCGGQRPAVEEHLEEGSIKGVVVSEEKIPIDGAEVILVERGETWIAKEGRFVISGLPVGSVYSLLIRHGEKASFIQGIMITGDLDIGNVVIKDTGSIKGQVVGDFEDDFSGAEVFLLGTPFSTVAGKLGDFRIELVPEGIYRIVVKGAQKEIDVGDVQVISGKESDIGVKKATSGRTRIVIRCEMLGESGAYTVKVMELGGELREVMAYRNCKTTGICTYCWHFNDWGYIALSPDGKKLAFVEQKCTLSNVCLRNLPMEYLSEFSFTIWVIDIETGAKKIIAEIPKPLKQRSPRSLTPPPFLPLSQENFDVRGCHSPCWSPDGHWIGAIIEGIEREGDKSQWRSYAIAFNSDGPSDQEPLVVSRLERIIKMTWSPDGSSLAVNADGAIYIEEAGKPPRRITKEGTPNPGIYMCWSPDQAKLYCSRGFDSGITIIDANGGKTYPFKGPEGQVIGIPVGFSSNGQRIFVLYANHRERSQIERWIPYSVLWAVKVDGSSKAKVVEIPPSSRGIYNSIMEEVSISNLQ